MSGTKPRKVSIEFDDGSKTSAPFEALPTSLQLEIMRQPFACKPSPNPEKERFVLLEWDDGWKEVIKVDAACIEINRYYVISRVEDIGRLSLNRQHGYPDLIEVLRKPLNLKKITFMDTFQLALSKSEREGRKTDHFFALSKEGKAYSEIIDTFRKVIEEEGIDLQDLMSRKPDVLSVQYESIRRKMGIKAGFRQQDVLDFIAYLVESQLSENSIG